MGKEKYAVGIDFGTLSGRAVLARLSDGEILGRRRLPAGRSRIRQIIWRFCFTRCRRF